MADRVKPKRAYDSSRRRAQAAATRRDILQAAQRLFEQQGYPATSMTAIADEAGVAVKTVYLAFETKRGVLLALWHLLLRGDEEPVPIGQRPWYQEVIAEPDSERKLFLTAHNSRLIKERAGPLMAILRSAAPTDPDLDALWQRIQTDFYDHQRRIVDSLAEGEALRPGLDVARAADLLWTLNHPDVYWLLVGQRGWTPEEYEEWLADAFCAQLLR